MRIWVYLAIVCSAGAIGGVINALLIDQGFVMPRKEKTEGRKIFRPGFLSNLFTGAVAAGISWGLYGPLASYPILSPLQQPETSAVTPSVSLSSLVGAVLVGIGGARWLMNEVDKSLLKTATSIATATGSNPALAERMLSMSVPEILEAVDVKSDVKNK